MSEPGYREFNINDKVRIRLTDYGRTLHRSRHEVLFASYGNKAPKYDPPHEDEEGWSVWQMWTVMEIFGDYLQGRVLPFHTTIEVYLR